MAPRDRRINTTTRRKAGKGAPAKTSLPIDAVGNSEDVDPHDRRTEDSQPPAPGSADSDMGDTGELPASLLEATAPKDKRKNNRRKRNSLRGARSERRLAAAATEASEIGAERNDRREPDQEPQDVQSQVPSEAHHFVPPGLEGVSGEADQAYRSLLESEDLSETNISDLAGGEITGHGEPGGRDVFQHAPVSDVEGFQAASPSEESGAIYEGELLTFAAEEYAESHLEHPSALESHSAGAADIESSESVERGGADHVLPSATDFDDFSVGEEVQPSALETDADGAGHEDLSPSFDLEPQFGLPADHLPGPKSSVATAKSGLPGFDLKDQEDLKLPAAPRFFRGKQSQTYKDAKELGSSFRPEPTGAVSPVAQVRSVWQNVPHWYAAQLERFKIHPNVGAGIIFIVILLLTSPLYLQHQAPKNNNVPDFLIGVWKTPTPGYEYNSLEIKKHALLFETGPSVYTINVVTNVDLSNADKEDLYTLHYTGDDPKHEYVLSFYYYPDNGGLLKFKGEKNLEWKKLQ